MGGAPVRPYHPTLINCLVAQRLSHRKDLITLWAVRTNIVYSEINAEKHDSWQGGVSSA